MGATSISALLNPAVNELLGFASPNVALVLGATIIGPLDEEPAKGIALVIVFALSYLVARRFGIRMFDGVTNGIVYGVAVGLGFSFAEDILYFFNAADAGDLERGLNVYLMRVGFFGPLHLQHAVAIGAFGAGLGSQNLLLVARTRGRHAHARHPQRAARRGTRLRA